MLRAQSVEHTGFASVPCMGSIMALQGVKKLSEVPYKGCVTVDGFVQDLEFGAENDL